MRLLFLNGLFPQLSQTFVLDQIAHAAARGHAVEVAATRRVGALATHAQRAVNPPVRSPQMSLRRRQTSRLRGLYRRARALREGSPVRALSLLPDRELLIAGALAFSPEVIVVNFGTNLAFAARLRARYFPAAKLACIFHGFDVSKHPREHGWKPYQELASELDLAIAVNGHFAAQLRAEARFRRVEVLHLGVDRAKLPVRMPHQDTAFSLLFVGRMVEKKGAHSLLEAVANLHELPWRLHMVGDGPLLKGLMAYAHALGVADRVVFYGAREHEFALRMMASCDCFVLPSVTASDGDMEGIPVSLMEAMAIGTPVVSTFHSGIPELITDGVHGRLVPEHDTAALASALREVHASPARWVQAAHEHVAREFSLPRQYDRLLAALERLLSAHGVSRCHASP